MSTDLGAPPRSATVTSADERRRLDLSLARGIAWTGGMKWFTQVLSWAATLVIARILSPADYGLFGMATLYVGLVQLVNEFGLGAAIVRQRDLSDEQVSLLGGLSVGLSVALWGLSVALAPLVAWAFGEPALRPVLMALGATFVLTAFKVLPRSLLSRDLRFKQVAALDAIEALVTTAATLSFALVGLRHWALVLGAILGGAVSAAVACRWRPHPLAWPRRLDRVAAPISFGGHLVASRVAWYAYSNADFAVVGRVLGTVALGAYSFGWTIATIPVQRISALVGQVTPAIFSAVQKDREALGRYLILITEALALVTFPFSAGLALVAPDLVLVALGEKWAGAVLPLRLLALYAGVRSVTTVYPHVLGAVGRSQDVMRFSLFALMVLPPLFYLGSHWGPGGVAAAWILGYPVVMVPPVRRVLEVTGITLRAYLAAVWPALSGTLLMAGLVLAVRQVTPETWPRAARLGLDTAVGALSYTLLVYGAYAPRVRRVWGLLRDRRR